MPRNCIHRVGAGESRAVAEEDYTNHPHPQRSWWAALRADHRARSVLWIRLFTYTPMTAPFRSGNPAVAHIHKDRSVGIADCMTRVLRVFFGLLELSWWVASRAEPVSSHSLPRFLGKPGRVKDLAGSKDLEFSGRRPCGRSPPVPAEIKRAVMCGC